MTDLKLVTDKKISRLRAAIGLEPVDKVPVAAIGDFWAVRYAKNCTMQEAFYNMDLTAESYKEVFSEWNEWDAFNALLYSLGPMHDALGSKRYNIPGREISPQAEFQHPDLTLMSAAEYQELIKDPYKFQMEVIIPRLCSRVDLNDFTGSTTALVKAALFFGQFLAKAKSYNSLWLTEYGIPPLFAGVALYLPIDWIADKLRGFRQGLLDIKERPEEVQAACEALVPLSLYTSLPQVPVGRDFPLIFNPQHVSPFLSPKDYEKVYWPTFKKIVDEVIGRGYKMWVLFENNQEQHLERLQDLPHGKIVAHFEDTDLIKVKKALGGKFCIAGGMPSRLLAKGTPQEIREHTKSVLKLFADEPGFIMTCGTTIPSNVKPENIHAWFEALKEYGQRGGEIGTPVAANRDYLLGKEAGKDIITSWESVREEFGKIAGEEKIIKERWEELEKLFLPFFYWLIK